MSAIVSGTIDPRFAAVGRELERNLRERGEVGAAVAVNVDGRLVVDAWGGLADPKTGRSWDRDTIVMVFSSTKGASSLLLHRLAEKNELDLDQPVARLWPAFEQGGKEQITPRLILSHQGGLPALDELLPVEAAYDHPRIASALAAQSPHWPPGKAHGYHPFTFGWLVGEIVRRCRGQSFGRALREEVTEPLGVELWVGLPESEEPRVARLVNGALPESPTPMLTALMDRSSLTARSFLNPPTFFSPKELNSRAMRAAEIPAANGVASARGLCRLYTALAGDGSIDGMELVSPGRCRELGALCVDGPDRVLLQRTRFSSGFMKTMESPYATAWFGPNDEALGHVGAGGSFGFADPTARVAVGYVMNAMGSGALLNERGQRVIEAVYEALGTPRREHQLVASASGPRR